MTLSIRLEALATDKFAASDGPLCERSCSPLRTPLRSSTTTTRWTLQIARGRASFHPRALRRGAGAMQHLRRIARAWQRSDARPRERCLLTCHLCIRHGKGAVGSQNNSSKTLELRVSKCNVEHLMSAWQEQRFVQVSAYPYLCNFRAAGPGPTVSGLNFRRTAGPLQEDPALGEAALALRAPRGRTTFRTKPCPLPQPWRQASELLCQGTSSLGCFGGSSPSGMRSDSERSVQLSDVSSQHAFPTGETPKCSVPTGNCSGSALRGMPPRCSKAD